MDSFEDNQEQLLTADHRSAVALAAACAERTLGLYADLGSGDAGVLTQLVEDLWAWVDGRGELRDVDSRRELVEEYADAHYDEGDNLLEHVVTTVLEALDAYAARKPETVALHVARALETNAEIAEECDGMLSDAGAPPSVTAHEERWRLTAIRQTIQGTWMDRATLLDGGSPWLPAVIAVA